jgi:hypothetical protein
MGFGPQTIEHYRQMKMLGLFDGISNVMELGSQDFYCPQQNLMKALFAAFGLSDPPPQLLNTDLAHKMPTRALYEALGLEYNCVDVDGRAGTLVLDLNFDETPQRHRGRYGLVTNYGTSEHILNQTNVFKTVHDFARVGGVIIHCVPFMGYVDHGFFSYHPNLFESVARYNSYEILGLWIGAGSDGTLASYCPWDVKLLEFLSYNSRSAHILIVAFRKLYDKQFCVPFQAVYESVVPGETLARYAMVIDGNVLDGQRVRCLAKKDAAVGARTALEDAPGREILRELRKRVLRRISPQSRR